MGDRGGFGRRLRTVSVGFRWLPLASAWPGGDGHPDIQTLSDSLTSSFVRFWAAGGGQIDGELARAVDFWALFHLVKAALAAGLLSLLVALGTHVGTAYSVSKSSRMRRRLLLGALIYVPVTVLALLILVANVQGAIAPPSSALRLLPLAEPDAELRATSHSIMGTLTADISSPGRDLLIHHFASYHASMAWLGALVTLALSRSQSRSGGGVHSCHTPKDAVGPH